MPKPSFLIIAICSALFSTAQVPVKYEPRHHNVFENEYIRVLDVHIGPGDTTLYHVHSTPSVFYTFTKTMTTSQLMGRPASRSSLNNPGPPSYDSLGTARIHRVWNDDSTWFHVMDIELLSEKPQNNPAVLQLPFLTLSFNRYLANGYRLQMNARDKTMLPATSIGYLVVSQGDADIQYQVGNSKHQQFMRAGHYIWVGAGDTFSITDVYNPVTFMVLQLK